MPETINAGKQDGTEPPKKEMSMEVRLLLAFLLMGAVMFLTPYFVKSPPASTAKKTTPSTASGTAATPESPAPTRPQMVESSAAPTTPATPQQVEPSFIVDTDVFRIAFSNQGATVRSWVLKK